MRTTLFEAIDYDLCTVTKLLRPISRNWFVGSFSFIYTHLIVLPVCTFISVLSIIFFLVIQVMCIMRTWTLKTHKQYIDMEQEIIFIKEITNKLQIAVEKGDRIDHFLSKLDRKHIKYLDARNREEA